MQAVIQLWVTEGFVGAIPRHRCLFVHTWHRRPALGFIRRRLLSYYRTIPRYFLLYAHRFKARSSLENHPDAPEVHSISTDFGTFRHMTFLLPEGALTRYFETLTSQVVP